MTVHLTLGTLLCTCPRRRRHWHTLHLRGSWAPTTPTLSAVNWRLTSLAQRHLGLRRCHLQRSNNRLTVIPSLLSYLLKPVRYKGATVRVGHQHHHKPFSKPSSLHHLFSFLHPSSSSSQLMQQLRSHLTPSYTWWLMAKSFSLLKNSPLLYFPLFRPIFRSYTLPIVVPVLHFVTSISIFLLFFSVFFQIYYTILYIIITCTHFIIIIILIIW